MYKHTHTKGSNSKVKNESDPAGIQFNRLVRITKKKYRIAPKIILS